MMSDGEFQEGQIWEGIPEAAKFGLDNLKVIVDVNGQQCDGCIEPDHYVDPPCRENPRPSGASAITVDGHDLNALEDADVSHEHGQAPRGTRNDESGEGTAIARGEGTALPLPALLVSDDERQRYEHAYEAMVK